MYFARSLISSAYTIPCRDEFAHSLDSVGLYPQVQRQAQVVGRKVVEKAEELSFDMERAAERWNREYQLSEKAEQVLGGAAQQMKEVDERFAVMQRLRNAQKDFQLRWPRVGRCASHCWCFSCVLPSVVASVFALEV